MVLLVAAKQNSEHCVRSGAVLVVNGAPILPISYRDMDMYIRMYVCMYV